MVLLLVFMQLTRDLFAIAKFLFLTVFVSEWAFFNNILLSPAYAPGTIAVIVTRLERAFNACKTPRCIYPSIFNRFWDIASFRSKRGIFVPQLCLAAPQGVTPLEFREDLDIHKTIEWMGYRVAKKAWQYVQPFWYSTSVWRTDRRTDGQPIAKTWFSIADARKNTHYTVHVRLRTCTSHTVNTMSLDRLMTGNRGNA